MQVPTDSDRCHKLELGSLAITPRHKAPRFVRVYIAQISMLLFLASTTIFKKRVDP